VVLFVINKPLFGPE